MNSQVKSASSVARGLRLMFAVSIVLASCSSVALAQAATPPSSPQPIGKPVVKPVAPAVVKPVTPAPVKTIVPTVAPVKPAAPTVKPATPTTAPAKPTVTSVKPVAPVTPLKPAVSSQAAPVGFGAGGYSSAAMPLASVGRQVGWRIDPDDLRVFVPQAANGREIGLEVYSPEVNRNDYANGRDRATYYGDELYGKTATLSTNFSLMTSSQQTLLSRTFSEGLKHSYEQLLQSKLTPGYYPLTVVSNGNGKNSYAVRVTSGARVEASQFTVNARGQFNRDQVVGFVQIDPSQLGKTIKLENYDADGPTELVLTLVKPDGSRVTLKTSPDTQWASNSFVVNQSLVGTWKILARILPTTKQFSNAFAVRLRANDQALYAQIPGFAVQTPPAQAIQCDVVDLNGINIPGATCVTTSGAQARVIRPVLPECYSPVAATIIGGAGRVISATQIEITSPSGSVRFVATCPEARVQVNAVALTCGTRVPLSNIGFTVAGQIAPTTTAAAMIVAPGAVTIAPSAIPGSTAQPVTVTAVRGSTVNAILEYSVTSNITLTPQQLELEVGQTATLVATATTLFPTAIPATLQLTLPAGLEATGPVRLSGTISSTAPLTLRVPVKATAAVTNASIRASLEPNCNLQALSSVTITEPTVIVAPPAPPPPAPPAPPAKLELTKTVNRDLVKPGETPVFTVTVTNTGGSVATDVRLTDALPAGLRGANIDQTFNLEPGASKTVTLEAVVEDNSSGVIVNTANVNWNGATLTASAQVRVQPVIDLSITKTVTPANPTVGDTVTYTITVTNAGPSSASDVTMSDPLPAGLTYVSSTTSRGATGFAAQTVTANIGLLSQGGSATVTVKAVTTRAGRFNNTASVKALQVETSLENNRAGAVIEVIAPVVIAPVVIAQGTLEIAGFAVNCGLRLPLPRTEFLLDGQRLQAPTSLKLAPGVYTLQPASLPGSTVRSVTVAVTANQSVKADLEYNVAVSLSLTPKTLSLTTGETATLTATATTLFPYAIPTNITAQLPAGIETSAALTGQGKVSSGQSLSLTVAVRAVQPVANATVRASLGEACVTDSSIVTVTAKPLPEQRRESSVVLLAKLGATATGLTVQNQNLPSQATALILSDRVPAGATYIAGSSRLVNAPTFSVNTATQSEGKAIADPFVSGDRLFWVLALKNGAVTISRSQALSDAAKRGLLTMTRNAQGETVYGLTYKLAHTARLVMPEDRVGVIAVLPARSASTARSDTRIVPGSPLERLTGPGELLVLQGSSGLLTVLGNAVPFSASSSDLAAAQRPVGGIATTLRVRVERPTTDSIDAPTIVVEAFDRNGLPASDAFATLEANVDFVDRDAAPLEGGYQVKLVGGVGRARMQSLSGGVANQSNPPITDVKIEARVTNATGTISSSTAYRVGDPSSSIAAPNPLQPTNTSTTAVSRPVVAVGTLSAGGTFDFSTSTFTLDAGLRFALRGDIAPGLGLTLGINLQATVLPTFGLSGSLNPVANPHERFPVLGDSSTLGSDIRSSAGLYAKLEFGSSFVLYGDFNPGFTGVLSGYNANYTGVQALLRGDGYRVNAFATDAPLANQRFVRQADGSDIYFLQTTVNPSSERVTVVTYQLPAGFSSTANLCTVGERIKLRDNFLNRNADYTIDYQTGIVRLRQAVNARDPNGNIQCLEVDYASSTPGKDFRYGAQATIGGDSGFSFKATALQYRNGSFGGNSSLLFGTGVRYSGGGFDASLEGAYSGVFAAGDYALAAGVAYTAEGFGVRFNYQNRGIGFIDPNTNTVQSGQSLNAGFLLGRPDGLRATLNGDYTQSYAPGNPANLAVSGELRNTFSPGFSAGLGLAYNRNLNTGSSTLFGTAGLEISLGFARLSVLQRVPVIGGVTDYGDTTLAIQIPLSSAFSLRLSDKLTYVWNGVQQQITFGVTGSFTNNELLRTLTGNEALVPEAFGQTNVSADYQIDTVSGNAGRARVGFETNIPLSDAFSLQLGGEAVFSPNQNEPRGSVSLGGLYRDTGVQGSLRTQFSMLPQGLKQVYTAQLIAQINPEFVLSPTLEYAVDPSLWGTAGAKFADGGYFSVAAAYRGNNWSLLVNNVGKFGLYSPTGDKIEGELQFGYQASEVFYLRSSLAYRYLFGGAFTAQIGAGLQYFLTDSFAIGAQGALQFQPATGFFGYAAGLEGSLKVVGNLLFTIGFNFVGLNTSLGGSLLPGLYFRFDWKIDERSVGWR